MTWDSFTRYLAAKRSVDDRALHPRVWRTLTHHLPSVRPLRVLEVGSGIGTMLERMVEWGLLVGEVAYTAVDASLENTTVARSRLHTWATRQGFTVTETRDGFSFQGPRCHLHVSLITADVFAFARQARERQRWDLLVAHAFLDLVDLHTALPSLFGLLDDGLFYFTINFDGVTILEPPIDPEFDTFVMALYHQTMDERLVDGRRAGASQTGRQLLHLIPRYGGVLLDVGSSDWIVYPREGRYPADEAYFLHFIIETIHRALDGHPALDPERWRAWIEERHRQVDTGHLIYIAHQIDVVGRYPGPRARKQSGPRDARGPAISQEE